MHSVQRACPPARQVLEGWCPLHPPRRAAPMSVKLVPSQRGPNTNPPSFLPRRQGLFWSNRKQRLCYAPDCTLQNTSHARLGQLLPVPACPA